MPGPPRVKCIVLLFFLCPYATFKILFSNVGGKMSFSHRPTVEVPSTRGSREGEPLPRRQPP